VYLSGERLEELTCPTRSEAVDACWLHFREHGDPGWVAFIDAHQYSRATFDGFKDVSDEQRAAAQSMVDRYGDKLTINDVGPDVDTVILAAQMMQFVEYALNNDEQFNPGKKSRAVMLALFDGQTVGSEVASLMLSMLVLRMYSAPYGSLNEAALDFVNTLLPVLDTALTSMRPRKLKHPGG